jgi:hypothetical protein
VNCLRVSPGPKLTLSFTCRHRRAHEFRSLHPGSTHDASPFLQLNSQPFGLRLLFVGDAMGTRWRGGGAWDPCKLPPTPFADSRPLERRAQATMNLEPKPCKGRRLGCIIRNRAPCPVSASCVYVSVRVFGGTYAASAAPPRHHDEARNNRATASQCNSAVSCPGALRGNCAAVLVWKEADIKGKSVKVLHNRIRRPKGRRLEERFLHEPTEVVFRVQCPCRACMCVSASVRSVVRDIMCRAEALHLLQVAVVASSPLVSRVMSRWRPDWCPDWCPACWSGCGLVLPTSLSPKW